MLVAKWQKELRDRKGCQKGDTLDFCQKDIVDKLILVIKGTRMGSSLTGSFHGSPVFGFGEGCFGVHWGFFYSSFCCEISGYSPYFCAA